MSDSRAPAKPGAYTWYVLGLLTCVNAINFIDRNIVFALFEPIKRELALTDTQLGWLGSAYIVVFSLTAVPLGILSDLKSRRAVMAAGVMLWSAFTGLSGLARQYWQLLTCRSMVGIGEAAYSPAAQSFLSDYFPPARRAFALGVFWSGLAVGGVAGIWLGGELEHLYGWRAAFLAVGLPGLVLATLTAVLRDPLRGEGRFSLGRAVWRFELTVWPVLRAGWPLWTFGGLGLLAALGVGRAGLGDGDLESAVFSAALVVGVAGTVARAVRHVLQMRQEAEAGAPASVTLTTVDEFLHAARFVLRTPTLIWAFLGGALISFAMNGLVGWSPTYLQRVLGLPPEVAGRTIGVWGLAAGVLGVLGFLRRGAAHHAPRAVAGGAKRPFNGPAATRQDEARGAHRARDQHDLARPGAHGALAVDDAVPADVVLPRGVVVMHVDQPVEAPDRRQVLERTLDDIEHPRPVDLGEPQRELHRRPVADEVVRADGQERQLVVRQRRRPGAVLRECPLVVLVADRLAQVP